MSSVIEESKIST
jgi:ATP-binding cassette, subfamily F, member 3